MGTQLGWSPELACVLTQGLDRVQLSFREAFQPEAESLRTQEVPPLLTPFLSASHRYQYTAVHAFAGLGTQPSC